MNKRLIYLTLTAINLIISLCMLSVQALTVENCVYYAIATILLVGWCFLKIDDKRVTYSTALLSYVIATQFGLVIPYVLVGRESLMNYSSYTLRFLDSPFLPRAILLGIIAANAFSLGVLLSRKRVSTEVSEERKNRLNSGDHDRERFVGMALLMGVALFFAYHIITGGMAISATYEQFRTSVAFKSSLYHYILILFYVGTVYLAAAGKVRDNWPGWLLWGVIVVIFALNGNKGEFMYALLAVVGMSGVKGKKITLKMVVMLLLVLFVVIPSITTLRMVGIAENLRDMKFEPLEAFTEMGMQIRTTVYTMEGMENGKISYLYGMSYIQPVINILTPFMEHTQATAEIKEMFAGYGYSQVIESYLNFGTLGVLGFFGIMGFALGKAETTVQSAHRLAYYGTITCILINATRNYFAFVPGQILIVTLIYIFAIRVRFTWHRRKKSAIQLFAQKET